MKVSEEVYRMLARGTVALSNPPSFKLDVAECFNNHWHVKGALLKDIPATGVRLYFDAVDRQTAPKPADDPNTTAPALEVAYVDAALEAGQPCSRDRFFTGECNDQVSAFQSEGE